MGTDMTVVDTLDPFQVEIGDYVKFFSDGEMREGLVNDIDDNGSGFAVTLNDQSEGDTAIYNLDYDSVVYLMMYDVVAV